MNILKFKQLKYQNSVVHGISTKESGTMKNAKGEIDRVNLNKFLGALNLSTTSVCMQQVHGANVTVMKSADQLLIKNTDGLITNLKNLPLCVVTADCLPILFFDKQKNVIGVAHAGRKGLEKGILENMINKFQAEFGSATEDLMTGIGPGICEKCYEVDGELVDIRKIAMDKLVVKGVKAENIESMDVCTKTNPILFYSYRGGDISDRFVSVIALV